MLVEIQMIKAILEIAGRNEEHVIGNWRKVILYKMTKNLAELCSCFTVLWEVKMLTPDISLRRLLSKELKKWLGSSLLLKGKAKKRELN